MIPKKPLTVVRLKARRLMASMSGLGMASTMASMEGSPAKAENFAVAIVTSRNMTPHQINRDFRLAFNSRRKMFTCASSGYGRDVAADVEPVTDCQCNQGN